MKATVQTRSNGGNTTLLVQGDFRFDAYDAFRQAYAGIAPEQELEIDLRQVTSMDSSALGMLLNMKEQLKRRDGEIKLVNAPEAIYKLLAIARFDKKFQIL